MPVSNRKVNIRTTSPPPHPPSPITVPDLDSEVSLLSLRRWQKFEEVLQHLHDSCCIRIIGMDQHLELHQQLLMFVNPLKRESETY